MRFSAITILATLTSFAFTQSTDQLPKCGQACVGSNLGGCQPLDIQCICSNQNLISDLSCCVASSCSAADQNTIIQFAVNLCKTKGISVPTVASCASTASATSAASGSPAASGSMSSSMSISSSGTMSAQSASSSVSSAGSATAAAATSTGTGGAGHNIESGVGLGLVVAGLLAAL